jgi:glyoxylase-like metal-dependent hydrolase (beta-lactamase superfamily II)
MPEAQPEVAAFFDDKTSSVQYVVIDTGSNRCAIIDPVWDFDEKAGRTCTASADEILAFIRRRELRVDWILDTHPHADHFSAATYLAEQCGAPRAIGERITEVQSLWKDIYHLDADFPTDGRQWDRLFTDGEGFQIGHLDVRVMSSPGHTQAAATYLVGDAAFIHDTLFMPDFGTARADFPGGDARALYRSIQRILELPDATRLFTGHDYMPGGRAPQWQSSVAQQRACNVHLRGMDEARFVAMREQRDAELGLPSLMLAALQVNIRGGRLPPAEANGTSYLKIPLNRF